jgi:hypothetical protein
VGAIISEDRARTSAPRRSSQREGEAALIADAACEHGGKVRESLVP